MKFEKDKNLKVPFFINNSQKSERAIEFSSKISDAWKESITETISRIANRPLSVDIELPYQKSSEDFSDIISDETIFCRILDKNDRLMLVISLEWPLIGSISQAALGANTFRDFGSNRERSTFDKSFSCLFAKELAATIADVVVNKTTEVCNIKEIENGPLQENRQTEFSNIFASAKISVNIFDQNFFFYIYIYDRKFDYRDGTSNKNSTTNEVNIAKTRMLSGLSQTYITITAILRRDGFNLSDVRALQKGSILRLRTKDASSMFLTIQGREFGICTLGRENDQLTLRLDKKL